MFIPISLALVGVLCLLLLKRLDLLDSRKNIIVSVILIAAAMILRGALFFERSDDYLDFLAQWVQYFRDYGGFRALGSYPGNYNPPYMCLLALFSYFKIDDLYLIKLVSVIFDVLLAWVCTETAALFTGKKAHLLTCFFTLLFMPTVVINGAYWAQCDSIYTFFGIWSICLALKDKPAASMFALAASLAFKLQAVFIMPVFFVMLIAKKVKVKQLFIFPAAYVLYLLPAVIAGYPLKKALTLYVSQAGTVGDALNYNAPSLTSMLYDVAEPDALSRLLILSAFAFVVLIYIFAVLRRKNVDNKAILALAVLLSAGIPYLLPHMHDRYFYASEMLILTAVFVDSELLPMLILSELSSLHCYIAYFRRAYLVQPRVGGLLMLAVLIIAAAYAVFSCQNKNKKKFEFNT